MNMRDVAPVPWRVDRESAGKHWTDSCSIVDAEGGHVCHLTRGYQDGPSWRNAELIVEAVNAFTKIAPRE